MGSELTSTPSHPQKRRLAAPLAATAGLSHQITAPGGQEAAALAPDLPLRMPSVCGIQCWSGTQGSERDFRRLGTFREAGPAARPPPCQHQRAEAASTSRSPPRVTWWRVPGQHPSAQLGSEAAAASRHVLPGPGTRRQSLSVRRLTRAAPRATRPGLRPPVL